MDKNHKFFGSKLNSVLLLVLIILMIFALRIMVKEKEVYLQPFINGDVQSQINSSDKTEETEDIKNVENSVIKPKNNSFSKITFLKSLIVKYPNSVIKECDVDGKKYFVSDGQAFDGLAVFYSDSGVELETCGGMKPSVPPYASMCETVMPSCKIIYAGSGSGYDNVDTYNLN